jgi:hypothetical protein
MYDKKSLVKSFRPILVWQVRCGWFFLMFHMIVALEPIEKWCYSKGLDYYWQRDFGIYISLNPQMCWKMFLVALMIDICWELKKSIDDLELELRKERLLESKASSQGIQTKETGAAGTAGDDVEKDDADLDARVPGNAGGLNKVCDSGIFISFSFHLCLCLKLEYI